MRKPTATVVAVLTLLSVPVFADPPLPRDVPPGHWAAASVQRVTAQKLMTSDAAGKFHGDRAVTRYELAVTLDRLVRDMEAAHQPLSADPDKPVHLPRPAPAGVQAALGHLVGGGFLPVDSPLVVRSGAKPVTANELADALSQVTARLSDRSLPPQKE